VFDTRIDFMMGSTGLSSSPTSKECAVHARLLSFLTIVSVLVGPWVSTAGAQSDYTLFESGQVRPLAMSPNGEWLYVCNTPDGYLEAYSLTGNDTLIASIPVGLEPVSVAARNNVEIWVVNHLSDSVSIIDLSVFPFRVVRTLHVGDEPRDIVFAGPNGDLAFITTAHRGQNTPWPDGDYDVPGVGRADVWVFDATDLGTAMGGTPLTVINLFGDRPRALAASPDGSKVYAAVFRSGNQTTAISEGLVCDVSISGGLPQPNTQTCQIPDNPMGNQYPGRRLLPLTDVEGDLGRETGMIVGFDQGSGHWEDEIGRNWDMAVPFDLPDLDVFEIDANAAIPVELGSVPGVGTVLFNMIVNPANGDVYVTNTDANNRVRFEGMGDYVTDPDSQPKPSSDPATVRGNIHKSRITVLDASVDNIGTPKTEFNVLPRHLNHHLNPFYGAPSTPAAEKDKSLATPVQMAITGDGNTLYVAAFGSNGVGVYDTTQLKNDTFVPNAANIIPIPAGPSGLMLDEPRNRLYVASRTWNFTYVVDTRTRSVLKILTSHNPEPPEVTRGRPFLYDATVTSANGEASCSSCHVFGDMDDLSWDLGDPDGQRVPNPNPKPVPDPGDGPGIGALPNPPFIDPMKGPMTTQSLRGLVNSGAMHWRGDRTGPACASQDNLQDPACENEAFNAFNVAFPGLIGRDSQLDAAVMQAFTDFALRLTYPPNPIRALDNSMTPQQQAGFTLYNNPSRLSDQVANCNGCHLLDRGRGFFGSSGGTTFENETMEFKVPHLRNAYQKVGMFGQMPTEFFPDASGTSMGDQVRGTGFLHDGSISTVAGFLNASVFSLNFAEDINLEAFIMAFDSDLAPIVGQQVTLNENSGQDALDRVDLLIARANTVFPETGEPECDLIAKGVVAVDQPYGWVWNGSAFLSDIGSIWSKNAVINAGLAAGQAVTFTCVPPGSGTRMGVNRDRDRFFDGSDFEPRRFNTVPNCSVGPSTPTKMAMHGLFLLVLVMLTRRVVIGRRRRG